MVAGGGRSTFFSRGALAEIFSASRGIPRLINSLCDHALLGAYSENKEQVDKKVAQKAVAEIFGNDVLIRNPKIRLRLILTTAIILLLVVSGLWFGSMFLSNSQNSLDKQAQLEKLSELGKPPEPEKLPESEQISITNESKEQEQASLAQPPTDQAENSAAQGDETEKAGLSAKTNIVINPIEINE